MEAAQRYTDTSWRIFHQSRKKSAPTVPKPPKTANNSYEKFETIHEQKEIDTPLSNGSVVTLKENDLKPNGIVPVSNGTIPNSNDTDRSSSPDNNYERVENPESLQIVQIETVEVTYEPAKSQVEVVLVH